MWPKALPQSMRWALVDRDDHSFRHHFADLGALSVSTSPGMTARKHRQSDWLRQRGERADHMVFAHDFALALQCHTRHGTLEIADDGQGARLLGMHEHAQRG